MNHWTTRKASVNLPSSMFHVTPDGDAFVAYDAHGTRIPFKTERAAFAYASRRNCEHMNCNPKTFARVRL